MAIIEPIGGHGGMNYYDFGLCAGLAQAGIAATLYTCDETEVAHELPFAVKPYFHGIYGKKPRWVRATYYLLGLIGSLLEARLLGSEIIHFHFFHSTFLEYVTVKLARLLGLKIVITAHDVESFVHNTRHGIAKKIYSASTIVIAHNQIIRKELRERLHVHESKIRVIPHGNYIDFIPKNITQRQARKWLGLEGKGPVILFWGQIKAVKGLDLLLDALPHVVKRFPSLRLIIAGRVWKDHYSVYNALINEKGMTDHVVSHIQYIPDACVGYYFHATDLVVLPYRRIYQSGVLLMAMSYGSPVLVSDLEGMTEIIQDNKNGFVFRSNDSDHLKQRLDEILSDPQKMEEVALAGYDTVVTQHDWATIGRQTADVYRALDRPLKYKNNVC